MPTPTITFRLPPADFAGLTILFDALTTTAESGPEKYRAEAAKAAEALDDDRALVLSRDFAAALGLALCRPGLPPAAGALSARLGEALRGPVAATALGGPRRPAPAPIARPAPAQGPGTKAWTQRRWDDATLAVWHAALAAAKAGDPALHAALARASGDYPEVVVRALKGRGAERPSPESISGCATSGWDGSPERVRYSDVDGATDARRWLVVAHELGHCLAPLRSGHRRPWRDAYRAIVRAAFGINVPDLGDKAYTDGKGGGLDGRVFVALTPETARINAWGAREASKLRGQLRAATKGA